MNNTSSLLTRRLFLRSCTAFAVLAAVPACGPAAGLGTRDKRALLRMARLLYPHGAVADDVYAAALSSLETDAANGATLTKILHEGLITLDTAADGNWLAASEADQISALRKIESSVFFTTVQHEVRLQLYNHPAVWKVIGYPGSSLEYGGYINRGFDDIDWLPEV